MSHSDAAPNTHCKRRTPIDEEMMMTVIVMMLMMLHFRPPPPVSLGCLFATLANNNNCSVPTLFCLLDMTQAVNTHTNIRKGPAATTTTAGYAVLTCVPDCFRVNAVVLAVRVCIIAKCRQPVELLVVIGVARH
jgi:hypothetical protein